MKRIIVVAVCLLAILGGMLIPAQWFGAGVAHAEGENWIDPSDGNQTARIKVTITENGGGAKGNYSALFDALYSGAFIESDSITQFLYRPAARSNGTYDRTYIAGVNHTGVISVKCWDETALSLSNSITLWTIPSYDHDDHAGCSVIILQHQTGGNASENGTVLVAASHGFAGDYLGSRRSDQTSDAGITTWGDANIATSGASYDPVYPFLIELPDGTIYLFTQEMPIPGELNIYYRTLTLAADPDDDTWSARTELADLPKDTSLYQWTYYKPWEDGTYIHVALSRAYHDVFYIRYDIAGGHWETSDGTVKTLPLDMSDADHTPETVYASGEAPAYKWAAIWDIKSDPSTHQPHILFYDYTGFTASDQTSDLFHATYTGGAWSVSDTGINGVCFGVWSSNLNSGAELDQYDMNKLYASVPDGSSNAQIQAWENVGGTWYIADGNNGTTAIATDGKITQASPGDNFRPITVLDGGGHFILLWFYSEYYNFSTFVWESMRCAYPGFSNQNFLCVNKNVQADFDDLIMTQSDGKTLQPAASSGKPWIQEKTDNWRAIVWWKVGDIPAAGGNVTVYVYHGDPNATNANTQAIMDAQFLACDGFDNGTTLDTNKWTVQAGAVTIASGNLELTSTSGTRGLLDQNVANYPLFTYAEVIAKWRASDTTPGAYYLIGLRATNDAWEMNVIIPGCDLNNAEEVGTWTTDTSPNTEMTHIQNMDEANWHIWKIDWLSTSLTNFYRDTRYLQTNRLIDSLKSTHTVVSDNAQGLHVDEGQTASAGVVYVDWMFARPITNPEPIVAAQTQEVPDISNAPSSHDFGTVQPSMTYWAIGAEPGWPLADGNCTGNVTNLSTFTLTAITATITDFNGGTTINIVSGSPGANEVRVTLFESGAGNDTDGLILTNAAQNFSTTVAANESVLWELKLETGSALTTGSYSGNMTFATDPAGDSEVVTITFDAPATVPALITTPATLVSSDSATLNGNITSIGGEDLQYIAFVWGETDLGSPPAGYPPVGWAGAWKSLAGAYGVGAVPGHDISGLDASTLYYFYIGGNNSAGWNWSDTAGNFTTAAPSGVPGVATLPATAISDISGTIWGNLTATNGGLADLLCLAWGNVAGIYTLGNNTLGTPANYVYTAGQTFSHAIGSLSAGTTIFYIAQAHNIDGWATGLEGNFTTTASVPAGNTTVISNYIALSPLVSIGPPLFLLGFTIAGLGLMIGGVTGLYRTTKKREGELATYVIWGLCIVVGVVLITVGYYVFPSMLHGADQVRSMVSP